MTPLHEQFIAEARELIQQASDDLIALERDGFSAERVERVFRAFHTLKGSAGVVEMPAMGLAMHAAEDLLASIQSGKLSISEGVVSQGLTCLDQVAQWVDAFETHGALPPRADDDARRLVEAIRQSSSPDGPQPTQTLEDEIPEWARRLVDARRNKVIGQLGNEPGAVFAIAYRPREQCFLDGDDPLGLLRQIPHLLALELGVRWKRPLADLDPFACHLDLYALAAGDRRDLSTIFRLVPDQVEIIDVSAALLQERQRASHSADAGLVAAILLEQCEVLRAAPVPGDQSGRTGACGRAAANALRHHRRPDLADRIVHAAEAARNQHDVAPLLKALADAVTILASASQDPDRGGGAPHTADAARGEAEGATGRWLRIDEARIDSLINLAGELIVLKNSFGHLARRIEDEGVSLDLSRAAKREHEAVERFTGNLHDAILQLRMIPIGQVFRAFPRLARDLAQRLGKKVQLITRGETTETDKVVADRLFEPLLHLVRNAVDHGIEEPEERRAMGKPETATVTMQASRAGDRISIEISDDGRGIDPATVRRKAGESGLLPPDQLAALSDEDALKLIFSAGLSTATHVSDLSGRGVGMDVVRTTTNQIGGGVSITSHMGVGTTIRLDVPISIATSRIMVIESSGQPFGIPMDSVTETIRLGPDQIRQVKTNEGFVLRNRIVPICSLAELMKLPEQPARGDKRRLVMVVEADGKTIAIEIDAIRDRLDVVLKPMQGMLADAHGYAGTTLLGDGTVLLVLDVKEILA